MYLYIIINIESLIYNTIMHFPKAGNIRMLLLIFDILGGARDILQLLLTLCLGVISSGFWDWPNQM